MRSGASQRPPSRSLRSKARELLCRDAPESVNWTYDAGGRLTSVTDAPSVTVTDRHSDTAYDAVGRPLTVETYQGAGTSTLKLQTTTTYLDGQVASLASAENGTTVDTISGSYAP